jgi:hypothetical protein
MLIGGTLDRRLQTKRAESYLQVRFRKRGDGEPNCTAQLFEIEYGVTDLWTTAFYLEVAKTFEDGRSYDFASFRFENRLRLFKDETLLNPVLYLEYEQKKPESRYIRSVVGRTDSPEGPEETEHELETKLIFGHDISSRLNVAFNTEKKQEGVAASDDQLCCCHHHRFLSAGITFCKVRAA